MTTIYAASWQPFWSRQSPAASAKAETSGSSNPTTSAFLTDDSWQEVFAAVQKRLESWFLHYGELPLTMRIKIFWWHWMIEFTNGVSSAYEPWKRNQKYCNPTVVKNSTKTTFNPKSEDWKLRCQGERTSCNWKKYQITENAMSRFLNSN